MSEQEQRQRVVKALRRLDAFSVENHVGVGTPDVNYLHGWVELKCLDKWPKRPGTPVKLHHDLTLEQRIWLKRRWAAGGEAYVILQVQKTQDWLLFDGPTAARLIGTATQGQLRDAALCTFTRIEEQLEPCLSQRANSRRGSASSSPGAAGD